MVGVRDGADTGATGRRAGGPQWLDDAVIGAVPETWNWLEGWSRRPDDGHPNVVHFTRGGPWFENWMDVEFAELWLAEERALGALLVAS